MLIVLCFAAVVSALPPQQLLIDPGPSLPALYLTPNTTAPPIFQHQLYGPIGTANHTVMHLTQWDTSDDLPVKWYSGGNGPCHWPTLDPTVPPPLWWSNSSAGHVCAFKTPSAAGIKYELYQDGSRLLCGSEFDSFLEPNSPVYPAVPTGFRPSPTFDKLSFINVSFLATALDHAAVTQRCGATPQCGGSGKVDYAYAVLGVVASTGPQTLFYQVALGDSRDGNGCPGQIDTCKAQPQFWYANTNPFGVNDTPATFGYPCLGLSATGSGVINRDVYFHLNLLPRFLLSFKTAPSGMDVDPSHWSINGVYLGIGMEGSVKNAVVFHDWSVVAG